MGVGRVGEAGDPPIGVPIANTQVYVLDERRQLLPVGVVGELYVGGVGLARGYHGKAELTGERFVGNPFVEGGRLYRTGDRVRWRRDGQLAYMGRVDTQVKVRGFRIELGEVEAALRGHQGVAEAVVVVREDVPGDRRLVGYVVWRGEPVEEGELRAYLRGRLPEYMVPGVIVALEAVPMTPSGKVDRKGLPAPVVAERRAYVAPRDGVEERLAGICAELLGLERVGVEDSFFELGAAAGAVREPHRRRPRRTHPRGERRRGRAAAAGHCAGGA